MSAAGEGSRLVKLLALLETGSSVEIRKAAAQQVANVAQTHPAQLPSLIRQVRKHLRHKQWDTRIAASSCLDFMAAHFEHHSTATLSQAAGLQSPTPTVTAEPGKASTGGMILQNFNILQVLGQGTILVASEGQEYELAADISTRAEQLAKQRKSLKKRLGLDGQMDGLVNTDELISDADFLPGSHMSGNTAGKDAPELLSDMSGLSARERNKLKRKSRALQRSTSQEGSSKRSKSGNEATNSAVEQAEAEADSQEWQDICAGQWPFQAVCDQMCIDILDPVWEVRHGAAVALREVLRRQADAAAVSAPVVAQPSGWAAPGWEGLLKLEHVTKEILDAAHASNLQWLEDCAIRLLCVLALDRFGDFTSDQVVAPVRETAAQALGAAVQPLPAAHAQALLSLLHQLVQQQQWEVRHGGLLGLKYLLAARADAAEHLVAQAVPAAILGLKDQSDDVRAVAAEALLPVAPALAANPPQGLQQILWDILLEAEELSPSTGSVLQLLTVVFAAADAEPSAALEQLMPRLWPLFCHPLTKVRLAAVQCLQTFLTHSKLPCPWLTEDLLQTALKLVFQNLLMATNKAVRDASQTTWTALLHAASGSNLQLAVSSDHASMLFSLACTPIGMQLPQQHLLVFPMPAGGDEGSWSGMQQLVGAEEGFDVAAMRLSVAAALGQLAHQFCFLGASNPLQYPLLRHLQLHSATSRSVAALVITEWVKASRSAQKASQGATPPVNTAMSLSEPSSGFPYQEITQVVGALLAAPAAVIQNADGTVQSFVELSSLYTLMQQQAQALVQQCHAEGINLAAANLAPGVHINMATLSADQAAGLLALVPTSPSLAVSTQALALTTAQACAHEAAYYCTVTACLAAAVVHLAKLPAKLNQVIQPLMAALRREAQEPLQKAAAEALAQLMLLCLNRTPCPNDRVIRNVCTMACQEPAALASAQQLNGASTDSEVLKPSTAVMGASCFLQSLATTCKADLFTLLPILRTVMLQPLVPPDPASLAVPIDPKSISDALHILKLTGPVIHPDLVSQIMQALPAVVTFCGDSNVAVRCAVELADAHHAAVLPLLLRHVVPALGSSASPSSKQGAISLIGSLTQRLGTRIVPYLLLLVVPLMGCMADSMLDVRQPASATFAAVVALLPLAQGMDPPEGLDEQQWTAWLRDKEFLEQLMDNTKVGNFELPKQLHCTVRPYQQEGIAWLAFLRRTGLHGCLADDMGLGKTLQATAIIAAAIADQQASEQPQHPSIIVCPSTLVPHWAYEISKFVAPGLIRPLQYQGTPRERQLLQPLLTKHNVLVTSYESVKADVDWLAKHTWLYCVLDEGHIIRNPKNRITQACKALIAHHRLILTGTPIQNNVLELWSLFDFLMPGFLGSQARFTSLYGKALSNARTSKKDSREAQAGLLAMDALHKQVKPFILRRTKDAVLADLPPKILQDVFVDASPLQRSLYQDFAASDATQEVQGALEAGQTADADKAPHVFQALQYLRKLCSHPLLVLDPAAPGHAAAVQAATGLPAATLPAWKAAQPSLHQLHHAPKLLALKELLQECGIGWQSSQEREGSPSTGALEGGPAGHRVLVFAQLKAFLQLVEDDVLRPGGVSFLRLDGSVEAKKRFSTVQRFNSDPTIEVLLLTTHVGGLGLNLTSADTVIFLEHDWNPQKDLQAMDRAHRLGQKRTVNVYRLLTRDSLEDKIMGLQRFKLDMANSVVNQDNVSLKSMDAGRLLDLFSLDTEPDAHSAGGSDKGSKLSKKAATSKSVLDGLEELWDENQYAEEFSLQGFTSKLSTKP